jgi:TBC1 domain family protein 5
MMKGVGDWYQWREGYTSSGSRSPPSIHAQFNAPSGQLDFKPYVAPIVNVCNQLQLVYLKNVDPELCRRMQAAGIEPQIYGM